MKFVLFLSLAGLGLTVNTSANADYWLPKGYVAVRSDGGKKIFKTNNPVQVLPKEAAAKLKELAQVNAQIERMKNSAFHFNQASADTDLSQAEQKRAAFRENQTRARIAAAEAEKVKAFGPDADKLAANLRHKAEVFGAEWKNLETRTLRAKQIGKEIPIKNARFSRLEKQVGEASDSFLTSIKKVSVKTGKGRLGKAGVVGAAAAAIGFGAAAHDGAQAKELKPNSFQPNEYGNGKHVQEHSEVEIGVIDAK